MSAKAEKTSTLRLPGLIGLLDLARRSARWSAWSLQVVLGGDLAASPSRSSRRVSRSFRGRAARTRCRCRRGRSDLCRRTAALVGVGSRRRRRRSRRCRRRCRRCESRGCRVASSVVVDGALDPAECEAERLDRTLQPLEQVDRHQLLDALLAAAWPRLPIARLPPSSDAVELLVLRQSAREDVGERGVDGEGERLELLEDLVEGRARPGRSVSGVPDRDRWAAARGTRRSRWCRRRPGCACGSGRS